MQQVYLNEPMLPWSVDPVEARRFRRLLLVLAAIALALGILIPNIQLPERDVVAKPELEPQLARVILDPPVMESPVEETPPVVEPVEEPVPEPAKPEVVKPVEPPKPVDKVEAAREVAKKSGLLALNDQLAGMRDSASASGYKVETVKGQQPVGQQTERLVTNASVGSAVGVDDVQLARTGEQAVLEGRTTTQIEEPVVAGTGSKSGKAAGTKLAKRSDEEIRRTFEANKSALYTLYQRALRSNPTLQGTVLVEITIAASGVVSDCKILSSELQDPELERRLLARIKLINFGAKDVPEGVYTYTLGFLPS